MNLCHRLLEEVQLLEGSGGDSGEPMGSRKKLRMSREVENNCIVNLKCIGSHRVSLDCIDD